MKRLILVIFALFALGLASCASKKSGSKSSPTPVVITEAPPTGTGVGEKADDDFSAYGGTAELTITDPNTLSNYAGHLVNDPQDVKVNVNLLKYGNGYGGTVSIRYTDNVYGARVAYTGYFTSLIQYSGHPNAMVKEDSVNNQYNAWFKSNGKWVWHGFFEDQIGWRPNGSYVQTPLGSVIVVIDEIVNLGDGQLEDSASGSIWYRWHGHVGAPHPPTSCWFVSLGPYDCRAWKNGDKVDTTAGIHPGDGYRRLGKFKGLSLIDAFNDEVDIEFN